MKKKDMQNMRGVRTLGTEKSDDLGGHGKKKEV